MRKLMTPSEAETSKRRAELFVRNVLADDARADEIEDEIVEDYAERKGITLVEENPHPKGTTMQNMTKAEMADRIDELEAELEEAHEKLSSIGEILDDSEEPEDDDPDNEDSEEE